MRHSIAPYRHVLYFFLPPRNLPSTWSMPFDRCCSGCLLSFRLSCPNRVPSTPKGLSDVGTTPFKFHHRKLLHIRFKLWILERPRNDSGNHEFPVTIGQHCSYYRSAPASWLTAFESTAVARRLRTRLLRFAVPAAATLPTFSTGRMSFVCAIPLLTVKCPVKRSISVAPPVRSRFLESANRCQFVLLVISNLRSGCHVFKSEGQLCRSGQAG